MMRRLLRLTAVCFICACSDDDPPAPDAGPKAEAGSDTSPADAGVTDAPLDAPADTVLGPSLASCLDTPDELPRPPTTELPCDLIPPGLSL
jgi:hypothetical protein